jgi:hypothetical protein
VVVALSAAVAGDVRAASAAQYRRQAEVICEATSTKLNKVPKPKTRTEFVAFLRIGLGYYRQQHTKLAKLVPPKVYRYLHGKVLSLDSAELAARQTLVDRIAGGADLEKAFDALRPKLDSLAAAKTAAWKKLRVKACWLQ